MDERGGYDGMISRFGLKRYITWHKNGSEEHGFVGVCVWDGMG